MGKPKKRADWFPVYLDQRQYIEAVDDATAGRVLKAALTYLATGEHTPLDGAAELLFVGFRGAVDGAVAKFEATRQRNIANGSKNASGTQSHPVDASGTQSATELDLESDKKGEGDIQYSPAPASKNFSSDQKVYDHASEAYQIVKYLADEKVRDNPDRAQPTEAELQKQAAVLDELHTQNGVAWETIDNVLYFALDHGYWAQRVQNAYDLKRHFNNILADMTKM